MTDANQGSPADLRATLERTLGDTYAFERELGGGGMSRVFLAEDRALERRVVVKVLKHDMAEGVSVDRFRREIQLAAKLQHPHIVPLLASGEIASTPYFTMPFIEGESLRARLSREGELPVNEAVRILRHVAAALSYAHKHGVVHRDIKPDNVMLADEFALVTDFGVAKALSASAPTATTGGGGLTSLGLAIGTPAYMAPEQAVADPNVDHRADIYSWGIMAYEMLTGWPPFSGMSAQATLAAQAIQKPEPIQTKRPGLPPVLVDLVMRSLEKRPSDRPQTAGELLQGLDLVATSSGGTAATAVLPAARRRPWLPLIIGGAAVAIAAIALFAWRGSRSSPELPAASAPGGTPASTAISSVAVLPLENLGGDTADVYFSDGMTDELANALAKLPGLKVASRTSAYSFKGKNADPGVIGRALKVQALLGGTVRRAGNQLRVTAQLTNVSDGLLIWAETYQREAKDVFKVQDDIAGHIADALKLRLGTSAAQVSSSSRGTENLKAYDLYLRGLHFWNRRGGDNLRRAITYFEQAVNADPNYGRAYAGIASAYALLPEYTDSAPADAFERTRSAASRAIALDSGLAEAYTALGLASVHAWDYIGAEKQYRMALASNPRYATAHQWYGELLYQTGRVDSAIAHTRQATELDPLSLAAQGAFGYALCLAGQYDEAIRGIKQALELAPTLGVLHWTSGLCYSFDGRHADAIRAIETAARLEPGRALLQAELAYAYGLGGQQDRARAILTNLVARTDRRDSFPLAVARMAVRDYDAALTALEQAVERREIGLSQLSMVMDPKWHPLRSNPRFTRILERMNLAEWAERMRRR
ncbi:MAG TPA: protein kinase [Gemmatimonadaceae bacterium]|nr:protein kinase [Gemmatimonadaceae bacterium]